MRYDTSERTGLHGTNLPKSGPTLNISFMRLIPSVIKMDWAKPHYHKRKHLQRDTCCYSHDVARIWLRIPDVASSQTLPSAPPQNKLDRKKEVDHYFVRGSRQNVWRRPFAELTSPIRCRTVCNPDYTSAYPQANRRKNKTCRGMMGQKKGRKLGPLVEERYADNSANVGVNSLSMQQIMIPQEH